MLLSLPAALLFAGLVAIVAIRLVRPRLAFYWLAATVAALAAAAILLFLRGQAPVERGLVNWAPAIFFPTSPSLSLDSISWPLALAVSVLVLSSVLSDVARPGQANGYTWAGSLAIGGLAILAVLADNPLTLLLAWGASDAAEVMILLRRGAGAMETERVIIAFSARVAGVLVLTAAWLAAESAGGMVSFRQIPAQAAIWMLAAAGLRLGILPVNLPWLYQPQFRRSLGTVIRLAPAASSLMLVARAASAGMEGSLASAALVLSGLAALYGGAGWALAANELEGRVFWILGLASLAVAAALGGLPAASLAWGLAMLLPGGLLFLLSARPRWAPILAVLGVLSISALPYTPAWAGAGLFASPFRPLWLVFILAQALLIAGYLRHALRPVTAAPGAERWMGLIYPWALAALPLAHVAIFIWLLPGAGLQLSAATAWPGLLACALALGISTLPSQARRFDLHLPRLGLEILHRFFSLGWLYRSLWWLYRQASRFARLINLVIEGEGGLLWTLLILTLLLSLLAQVNPGG